MVYCLSSHAQTLSRANAGNEATSNERPPGSRTGTAVASASLKPDTFMTSAPSGGHAMLRFARSTPPKAMMSRR